MEIKNFTQFVNFVREKQLANLHPAFNKLVNCVMLYNSICSCGGRSNQEKIRKQQECNQIYRESVGLTQSFRSHFLDACKDNIIQFYMDNIHLLKSLRR